MASVTESGLLQDLDTEETFTWPWSSHIDHWDCNMQGGSVDLGNPGIRGCRAKEAEHCGHQVWKVIIMFPSPISACVAVIKNHGPAVRYIKNKKESFMLNLGAKLHMTSICIFNLNPNVYFPLSNAVWSVTIFQGRSSSREGRATFPPLQNLASIPTFVRVKCRSKEREEGGGLDL